jgi:trigger factor
MEAEETRTFNLTYPEDHYNADVAGQEAEITVHMKEIRDEVLPDLDDEFAVMVGDYEDLKDLKAKLRQNLEEQAETVADEAFEEAIWDALLATASVEFAEVSVDQEIDAYQQQFEAQMRQQGMDMDSFFQLTNTTPEAWREQIRPQAVERLKRRQILHKIIEVEGIEVTDDEVDAQIETVIEPLGDRADDMRQILTSEAGKLSIKQDLLLDKAQELLKSVLKADGTEAAADEKKAAAEEAEAGEPQAESDEDQAPVEKQNLAKIEGIGAKTADLLYGAGIVNYQQLADTEVSKLTEILEVAGGRYKSMKPDAWPERARELAG